MKVTTVTQVRSMDRTAIDKFGIPDEILMENAGNAAYFIIQNSVSIEGKKFAVFCGTGNNGGDGLVVARKLHSMGGLVIVFLMGDHSHFKGPGKKNFEIVRELGIQCIVVTSISQIGEMVERVDVIVDALFGTGLSRDVEGVYRGVISCINGAGKRVYSIDIPSGINGDNGQVQGIAVRAYATITFGSPKRGNLLYPGYEYGGKLYVSRISFPPELYFSDTVKIAVSKPKILPSRKIDAHKGDFGDVLFIAGASNYFGAPYFSAFSFLKAGGGYARLASPQSVIPFIGSKGSEIVCVPVAETNTGSISLNNKDYLYELSKIVDMVVIGPGLTQKEETQELVRFLIQKIEKPLIIDGDGITAVAKHLPILEKRNNPTVLTPHLGELARVSDLSIDQINNNKIGILQKTSERLNAIIVLKGAHSLIGFPNGTVLINMSGNAGMATAGSGDVLTGTIAALYGLGLPLEDSVPAGVFIHGFAGDLAAEKIGEDGITAQDILSALPKALKLYRESYDEIIKDFYHTVFLI